MRPISGSLFAICLLSVAPQLEAAKPKPPTWPPAQEAAVDAWREMRFGMFIHWGPVSLKGTEIGWSRGKPVPIAEYDALYKQFNPTKFDAQAWVALAKSAGMKYVVLTTKHHDGFCLWDTHQTDYNIMHSPFQRDVVKELSAACKEQGLRFGTYYSVLDFYHPDHPSASPGAKKEHPDYDRYSKYLNAQVTELVTNYGPLSTIWFDVARDYPHGAEAIALLRKLQPNIMINNRSGAGGDYDTPEQQIGKFQMARPWESCITICHQWAWKPGDKLKSLDECLHTLVRCVGGDGNLLLNVGPMPSGEIEPRQAARLKEIGAWLQKNGESIYGTRGGPYTPSADVVATRKGNTVYLHLLAWPKDANETIKLPALPAHIVSSRVLTGGTVTVKNSDLQLEISVPAGERQPIDTIVVLELDTPASAIAPIPLANEKPAKKKTR